LPVSIIGDDEDHQVVERQSIEGRSGPNDHSEILIVSPKHEIRPVGDPVGGFQPAEILEGSSPVVVYLPVLERSVDGK
jgi:hypothetical protein